MRRWRLLAVMGLSALLSACSDPAPSPDPGIAVAPNPDPAHNSANALDWAGTYVGILPCADCPGIRTQLTLSQDGAYRIERIYLERGQDGADSPLHLHTGRFQWDDAGQVITLDEYGAANHYRVEEGRLRQLDRSRQRIEGELAEHYVLQQLP